MMDVPTFRKSFSEWLDTVDVPETPLDFNQRFEVLRNWQRTLFTAGWMGASWSTEVGGQGLTPLHQLALSEELVRARAPQPVGLIGLDVIGPTIEKYGRPWQRTELLPRLLSGDDIWCQGFSEPEAGSDLASLRTAGRLDGDELVVSGQKVWTSWANQAQWCALLLRTDPSKPRHRGISYLLVDMESPGVTVRPLTQMTGDGEFCEVFFDEVRVPIRNLVGEFNEGWALAMHTLGTERGHYTLRRRVNLQVAVEDATSSWRAAVRAGEIQPGLSDRVAQQIGRAYVSAQALDGQTRQTIQRLVEEAGPTPIDSVDKLLLTKIEQRVYADLADLLGPHRARTGSNFLGQDVDRWVWEHLYSRAASIYGGTSQIQRNIIAQRALGFPRETTS